MKTTQLTPQQSEAITYLAQGYTQKKVAELIGVTPQTINTWVKNPSFKALITKRSDELNQEYVDGLVRLRLLALQQIAEVLEDGKPLEKLQAAKIVLATINDSLRA